jgi:hypothetical protein
MTKPFNAVESENNVDEIDLLDDFESLPEDIKKILLELEEDAEEMGSFPAYEKHIKALNDAGYDLDMDMDYEFYNLRKREANSISSGDYYEYDSQEAKAIFLTKSAVKLLKEATTHIDDDDRANFFDGLVSLLEDYDLLGEEATLELLNQ